MNRMSVFRVRVLAPCLVGCLLVECLLCSCSRRAPVSPSAAPARTDWARTTETTRTTTEPAPPLSPSADVVVASDEQRCEEVSPGNSDISSIKGPNWLVAFPKDRDDLVSQAGLVELDRIAAVLREHPNVCIEIVGQVAHLPGAGVMEYGRDLSLRRANRVREALKERGVAGWRLMTRGGGVDEPIDTNSTREGRQKNERIDFIVVLP